MYNDTVLEHFRNPRNAGDIDNPSGVGEVGNAACGDIMRIAIEVENDKIVDVKFKTFGCGAAIASSSMATEMVKGKTIDEALGPIYEKLKAMSPLYQKGGKTLV